MADLINRDLTQYVDDDQPVWLDIAALRNERWGAWCSGARKHTELGLYNAGRWGAEATCGCGWHSERWNCLAAAQYAWAMHVADRP
jgi:hypothetical protein